MNYKGDHDNNIPDDRFGMNLFGSRHASRLLVFFATISILVTVVVVHLRSSAAGGWTEGLGEEQFCADAVGVEEAFRGGAVVGKGLFYPMVLHKGVQSVVQLCA